MDSEETALRGLELTEVRLVPESELVNPQARITPGSAED